MNIPRLFTKDLSNPYADQSFELRSSRIVGPDGDIVFSQENIIVPREWSQVATDVLAQKYFRKTGVPIGRRKKKSDPGTTTGEHDCRQVFHRMAGAWADWGKRHGYFSTPDDATHFYDEICYMLSHQMAAPNSPQWFNTGLHFAYGIKDRAQGHFFVDPKTRKMKVSTSAYERPQLHACFIQSIGDDLLGDNGIMDLWTREARLFKYGSGTGTNFSSLRALGELLSGGGRSSGLMSFLRVGDRAAGAIKSGGTTRRAAKMVCLDADHPEIESFIRWKDDEEKKVSALVVGSHLQRQKLNEVVQARINEDKQTLHQKIEEARAAFVPESILDKALLLAAQRMPQMDLPVFDTDWQGEAYQTVSGQNSNNSVRIPHTFFEKLQKGAPWALTFRTDGEIAKELPASQLWQAMAKAAWSCADPGLQFDTTINEWHTCPSGGRINASNPCSEYHFIDDSACNLASLNLVKFFDEATGEFRVEDFRHACRLWTVVLEISVLMAQYPGREIAQNSFDYRTIGLGYANMGALLMLMNLPYGSPESLVVCGGITALMTAEAYATSAEMARELGPFPKYEQNKEAMLRVVRNHVRASHDKPDSPFENLSITPLRLREDLGFEPLVSAAREAWKRALDLGQAFGYRNAQATLIAPTGTIGLLMDCDTTGIEPEYALVKTKQWAGGGTFRMVNQSFVRAMARLGYTESQVEEITVYVREHFTVEGAPHLSENHYAIFDCSTPGGSRGQRFLSPQAHLDVMASAQAFLSGGISKTVHLRADATIEDVKSVFFEAWRKGLKSISIYREGSKLSQPLIAEKENVRSSPSLEAATQPCLDCGRYGGFMEGACLPCPTCGSGAQCSE